MDSAKVTAETSLAKNVDDTNQPMKEEVFESENTALKEKFPNTKEIKPKKSKSMTKNTQKKPDIGEMVLESFKFLKMRKGAPEEAISKHIADKYNIDMKKLKPRVKRFLKNGLENGYLEEGAEGRFKLKKKDVPKKDVPKIEAQLKSMKTNNKKPRSSQKKSVQTKRK